MDFMAFLFVTLFFGYLGMVVWDQWEERRHSLFTDDGKFLRHQFLRALAMAPTEPIALPPDAKFAVKQAITSQRCEVCHQSDCFDVPTGFCQRCDHRTL